VSPAGWCLQTLLLSWCSVKETGVSCRLVPANIIELVLSQGDWCLLQVGSASIVTVGWCLQDFIKKSFVVFSHLGFHVKSLCTVDYMFVCAFLINFL
jgi:hypothetical protein